MQSIEQLTIGRIDSLTILVGDEASPLPAFIVAIEQVAEILWYFAFIDSRKFLDDLTLYSQALASFAVSLVTTGSFLLLTIEEIVEAGTELFPDLLAVLRRDGTELRLFLRS